MKIQLNRGRCWRWCSWRDRDQQHHIQMLTNKLYGMAMEEGAETSTHTWQKRWTCATNWSRHIYDETISSGKTLLDLVLKRVPEELRNGDPRSHHLHGEPIIWDSNSKLVSETHRIWGWGLVCGVPESSKSTGFYDISFRGRGNNLSV